MPRWLWVATGTAFKHALDLVVGESLGGESLPRAPADQLLGAGAGRHALGLDAGQGAGAALRDDRGAAQGVDLLSGQARGRGRDRLRIASGDRHLGAQALLLFANPSGDVSGELLGAQPLAEHHGVDGRVDDLLEARHVDARLARVEVDEALQLGEEVIAGGSASPLSVAAWPASPPPFTLITFSMPRTPTRVRLISVLGRDAWTSMLGERTSLVSLIRMVRLAGVGTAMLAPAAARPIYFAPPGPRA